MDADVIVHPHKNKSYYNEAKEYCGLEDHNILIFNPIFNYLNDNNKKIDGTIFNRKSKYDYLITKGESFDISQYDAIYHLFFTRFMEFNDVYKVPLSKQFVHLYPMRLLLRDDTYTFDKNVNLITTQKYITHIMHTRGYKNTREILGGSFLQKNHTYTPRLVNNGKLKICFSSLKGDEAKGADIYHYVVKRYQALYPTDNVEFITIGAFKKDNKRITQMRAMSMEELKVFYDTVDIYINPHRGGAENGWPLGVEAMLRGSVLITTDVNNTAKSFGYSNDIIIVERDDIDKTVAHIRNLYLDRNLLNKMSQRSQIGVCKFYSYENQQQRIFDYIIEKVNENKGKTI